MEQIKELEEVLELLNTKQYTKLRQYLAELNDADIAGLLEELEEEDMLKVFRILPKDLAADVFSYLDMDNQQKIITSLSDKEATNIINNLMADDAADLLEEMPANIVKKLLTNASPEVRRDINHLLRYPEDSAGSIMTVEYVDLKENLTVNQAIERIRKVGLDSETINICYVLDAQRRLVGTVALRYLLLMDGDEIIGDIMHENVISINTLMDQEEVARQFKKYDFTAMPVVDNENRLVGIITVDDIVDIIEEETTEDMEKMAAIVPSDKPYMKTGVFETFKKRIPWLLLLIARSRIPQKMPIFFSRLARKLKLFGSLPRWGMNIIVYSLSTLRCCRFNGSMHKLLLTDKTLFCPLLHKYYYIFSQIGLKNNRKAVKKCEILLI